MKIDIVEFVEFILGLKLTEFQKKFLRTYHEPKDGATETLYLYINRSNKYLLEPKELEDKDE